MKNKLSENKVILALFERSWGEVDWILPVLYTLKKICPQWSLISVFSVEWKIYNPVLNNTFLYEELNNISDKIIYLESYSQNEINKIAIPDHVEIILKDNGNDVIFKQEISKAFPFAKIIAHPHGPTANILQKYNHFRNFNRWEKRTLKHDTLLIGKQFEAQYFYDQISDLKLSIVGNPRFEKWWIKKILNADCFLSSKEMALSKKKKRIFTFFTRGVENEFPVEVFDYVVKSVLETILSDEDNFLFVKLHPRQNIEPMLNYLNRYDSSRWMITSLHGIQISAISDFIITVFSSVILDALSVEKPVVEFHQYKRPSLFYVVDSDNEVQSLYRVLDIAVSVETKEKLSQSIQNYFYDNDHNIWEKQKKAYQNLCPPDDNASLKAANLILSLVDSRQDIKDVPLIQMAHTPIEGGDNIFFNPINKSFHIKVKRLKASGMPISSILLKEFKQLFKINNIFLTGTFNEHMINQSSTIFQNVYVIESATDLYQTKMMNEMKNASNVNLYHSAKILNTILSSNISNENNMFWLSNHEIFGVTTKSRSNISVIEELKAILNSHINNAVILINNVRYFRPIAIHEHEAQKYRQYPSLYGAFNIILKINSDYNFLVLGDIALAYLPEYNLTISPLIKAISLSRLYENNEFDINTVFDAENYIAFNSDSEEKYAIKMMYDDYFSFEEPGVGGYYKFWHGLTLFGEAKYNEAKDNFLKAYQLGCKHWRILWYLAKSAQMAGDMNLAKEAIRAVVNAAPHFKPAMRLYEKIGA